MAKSEIIVGLDIGTTKIAVVVGREDEEGKIEILGHGTVESVGVKRGVVANIDQTVESIKRAVKKAEDDSDVDISEVHVGIAGQFIKSIQHRGSIIRTNVEDEISTEDIRKMTESMKNIAVDAGDEIIAVFPQEYTVDGESGISNPVGMAGKCIESNFHIITAQTTSVKNIMKCVQRAGLELKSLALEPIASAEAVLSAEEKEAGVVLVDIGGGTTDVAVFHDNVLRHTAVIPFGGEIITEDIREGCTIIKKYAEDLKIKFGSALATEHKNDIVSIPGLRGREPKEIKLKNLASIIQARMEEILAQVYVQIKNSGYAKKLIAGVVITGGGSLLNHAVQLTEFITGMDTRIGYPNEHLSVHSDKEIHSPIYATSVGLVKLALDELSDSDSSDSQDIKDSGRNIGKNIFNIFGKLLKDNI
ncbi:cell division protein FtsA [Odoribacter sp. OttesenSCG-928-L07]|nr:cell division protein FtsA [Odoribacter sp. OttesenSCG-928-L07]MDL2239187.1 cell division protein FtsA [Bacteroidales bacterium OttesenSCG-928-L14]MDL2240531.1 cell division protein FtsA [Bacteroidales bacterium OttesenSCG-928-K22]